MGRVAKFTSEQVKIIADTVVEVGPARASKELLNVGIKVSPGGAFYWARKIHPSKFKPAVKKVTESVEAE